MFDFVKRWAKTQHELCQGDLSAFLDGRLTPKEHSRVERHLEECAVCRADLQALRQTVALLHAMPVMKLPRSFLISAGEAIRQRQVQRRRLAYAYLRAATAVATVLLVLVVSGDVTLRYQAARPAPRVSRLRPAATTMLVETAAVEKGQEAWMQPSPELPTIVAPAESFGASEAEQTEAAQEALDAQSSEVRAVPSKAFATAEGSPVAPTAAPTATPRPTSTPVPPTPAVSVPSPQPAVGEVQDRGQLPPSLPSGPWAFLDVLRGFLPWIELALALAVALLLATTLWLHRRQRLV